MRPGGQKEKAVFAAPRRTGVGLLPVLMASLMVTLMAAGRVLPAENPPPSSAAVVVSQKIRPYLDALQGIQSSFEQKDHMSLDVSFLEPETDPDHTVLIRRLKKERFHLLIAVGPEAMELIWKTFPDETVPKVFAMVLHPEKIVPEAKGWCGIPLDIPAQIQVREIGRKLPKTRRIGLIYDPANNSDFAAGAAAAARDHGIDIVPLTVKSRSDILAVFKKHRKDINALWVIPDHTVISESIILFLIKEAIASNVAVLGYNRFFTDSGAALGLVCDYQAIGKQAAAMGLDRLEGRPCHLAVPAFKVLLNHQVLEALHIPFEGQAGGEKEEEKP
ncbi:MAG: ABC transporter substrate-binding protein [Thermodesulfobacteriota bacterium]